MFNHLWFLLICPVLPVALLYGLMWRRIHRRRAHSRLPLARFQRPAGWSLQKRLEEDIQDFLFDFLLLFFTGVVCYLLIPHFSHVVIPLILAIGFSALLTIRALRRLKRISSQRAGLLGEQCVGVILDRLSGPECRVFHDLPVAEPGKKPWNIDHVVVIPAGVFVLETKIRRKRKQPPADGSDPWKVHFDGKSLSFPQGRDDRPLRQSRGSADWLAELLSRLNGTPVSVSPILILPGWWIDRKGQGEVTVLNEKEIASCLARRATPMPPERFRAICAQLEERCAMDLEE